jgi:hypothetical protein
MRRCRAVRLAQMGHRSEAAMYSPHGSLLCCPKPRSANDPRTSVSVEQCHSSVVSRVRIFTFFFFRIGSFFSLRFGFGRWAKGYIMASGKSCFLLPGPGWCLMSISDMQNCFFFLSFTSHSSFAFPSFQGSHNTAMPLLYIKDGWLLGTKYYHAFYYPRSQRRAMSSNYGSKWQDRPCATRRHAALAPHPVRRRHHEISILHSFRHTEVLAQTSLPQPSRYLDQSEVPVTFTFLYLLL